MTHSVNGNIVVCGRLKGYNRNLLNLVVANFMVNLYSNYSAKYDLEVITYTNTIINSDQNEPIIRVFNHQIRLFDFKPNIEELDKKNISLLIEVQSGSHVSISDTRYSSEIYNTTQKIYRSLKRKLPNSKGLQYLFDDEKKLYLPSEFRSLIR